MLTREKLKLINEKGAKVFDTCIKFRYLIAVVVFVLMVICKINFSSINIWANYISAESNEC